MKKIVIGILSIILLATLLIGCTSGSSVEIMSNEKDTSTSMAMSYEKFDGDKSKTIQIKDGEKGTVSVDIVSTSGELNILITDKDGVAYYQGNNTPTSTFSVNLDKEGEYTIKVEAKDHKGSYNISWNITK